MRRCALACWVMVALSLGGCGIFESFYKKPAGGGKSTAEYVTDVVRGLPYGEMIAGVIGLGGLAFGADRHAKHKKTHKENVALKAKLPPPSLPS